MRKNVALYTTFFLCALCASLFASSSLKVPVSLNPSSQYDETLGRYVTKETGRIPVPLEVMDALSLSMAANAGVVSDNMMIDNSYDYIDVDATSKNITLTLLGISKFPTGKVFVVRKTDSSAHTVTLSAATDKITGQSTQVISEQNGIYYFSSDGTTWTGAAVAGVASPKDNVQVKGTITAPGTTTQQTINKPCGRVNIAASGTSTTVLNNLVTANSIITAIAATNDATGYVTNVVAGTGTFNINTTVCTSEMAINFVVMNPL